MIMTNYDSFSHCHFMDIFFVIHLVAKELSFIKSNFSHIKNNTNHVWKCFAYRANVFKSFFIFRAEIPLVDS